MLKSYGFSDVKNLGKFKELAKLFMVLLKMSLVLFQTF